MKKLAFLFLFFSFFLYAEEIRSYKVESSIKEDGSVYIKEQIEYSFDGFKHGIYRDIPVQMKINGKLRTIPFKLDYILVDGSSVEYKKSFFNTTNGRHVRLKIGSATKLIKGVHTYTIAYSLSDIVIPNCLENKDCISLNSIGTSWQVPIKNIKALYYLPPILTQTPLGVKSFTGKFASQNSVAKLHWIDKGFLEVSVDALAPYEGLTTTFIYPHGLITKPFLDSFLEYWYSLLFVGILAYLYRLYQRFKGFEDNRSIAVMYEPPKGISVLEAGLLLDSNADNKDYAAAIIELAQKGFLKIYKNDNSTILEKIPKDTTPLSHDLAKLYSLLFANGRSFILQESVSVAKRLQYIFQEVNEALYEESVQKSYFKEKPYESKTSFLLQALPIVGVFLVYTFYWVMTRYGIDMAVFLVFPFSFSLAAIFIFLGATSLFGRFIAFFLFMMGVMVGFLTSFDNLESFLELLIGPVGLSFILLVVTIVTYKSIAKYTQRGAYLKTHLLGLKEFIIRVKEDEIKRRVKQDPLYLEKLLPYAILFGVSKHWLELFMKLGIATPSWYDGDIYDLSHFDRELDNSASYSESSSSSSSGFGGGGFGSGGGAGGGGGGSW